MRIVFIGPPGSGKGTQSQRLKDYLGIVHLSTGEMLREAQQQGTELGRAASAYMDRGELVPDEIVMRLVVDRTTEPDCASGCLFDGFPRTLAQAQAFDRILVERDRSLDLVISLEVSEELLRRRLLARGRHDDNEQTINERFRQHHELTEPLVDYYRSQGILRSIDGQGTPNEVFGRIAEAVDSARP